MPRPRPAGNGRFRCSAGVRSRGLRSSMGLALHRGRRASRRGTRARPSRSPSRITNSSSSAERMWGGAAWPASSRPQSSPVRTAPACLARSESTCPRQPSEVGQRRLSERRRGLAEACGSSSSRSGVATSGRRSPIGLERPQLTIQPSQTGRSCRTSHVQTTALECLAALRSPRGAGLARWRSSPRTSPHARNAVRRSAR